MGSSSTYRNDIGLNVLRIHDQAKFESAGKAGFWDGCPAVYRPDLAFNYLDDFYQYDATATVGNFAVTQDGTATIAKTDAAGGVLSIATQPTTPLNNDEAYLHSLSEVFLFAAGKKLWFEAKVKLTEANVDDANIVVGLSDNIAADLLVDDGAGLRTTALDAALFYKVDGSLLWRFGTSNNATQVKNDNVRAYASNTWYTLGFYFDGTATTSKITPWINGVSYTPHSIALSGLEEMHIVFGAKCGANTQIETLLVDYVNVVQLR
jgi:hypothetical protein